jgi:hypothetical protein
MIRATSITRGVRMRATLRILTSETRASVVTTAPVVLPKTVCAASAREASTKRVASARARDGAPRLLADYDDEEETTEEGSRQISPRIGVFFSEVDRCVLAAVGSDDRSERSDHCQVQSELPTAGARPAAATSIGSRAGFPCQKGQRRAP